MSEQNKRVAIPVLNGELSLHFGKCNAFSIIEIVDNKVVKEELCNPPEHTPGSYPRFLVEKGVNELIVGGIGGKAIDILNQHNVKVHKGVDAKSRLELIEDYIKGNLNTGDNSCDGGNC